MRSMLPALCVEGHTSSARNRGIYADGRVYCRACERAAAANVAAAQSAHPVIPPDYISQITARTLIGVRSHKMLEWREAGELPYVQDRFKRYWYSPETVAAAKARGAAERGAQPRRPPLVVASDDQRFVTIQDRQLRTLAEIAIELAADAFELTPTDLLGKGVTRMRDRVPHRARARWLAARLMIDHGATVASAARALSRDHSSILHGLAQAPLVIANWEEMLESCRAEFLVRLGLLALPACYADEQPASKVLATLPSILDHLPARDQHAVSTYVRSTLLGAVRGDGPLEYWGLRLLAADAYTRGRVQAVLTSMGHAGHVARIAYHASRHGLSVAS